MWKTGQWVLRPGLQAAYITSYRISLDKTQAYGPKPTARDNGKYILPMPQEKEIKVINNLASF